MKGGGGDQEVMELDSSFLLNTLAVLSNISLVGATERKNKWWLTPTSCTTFTLFSLFCSGGESDRWWRWFLLPLASPCMPLHYILYFPTCTWRRRRGKWFLLFLHSLTPYWFTHASLVEEGVRLKTIIRWWWLYHLPPVRLSCLFVTTMTHIFHSLLHQHSFLQFYSSSSEFARQKWQRQMFWVSCFFFLRKN